MKTLDRKLLRDLWHMRTQALAIALVVAAGVATLVLGIGSFRSLEETRNAYYERYRFADLFAYATRVPDSVKDQILEIPGVAAADTRIVDIALLDVAGLKEPGTGLIVSLPDEGEPRLNRLYMRQGRTPAPYAVAEVTVNDSFAKAHGFSLGSTFHALINGKKRQLTIVGIALSPEFIYALGPGDLVPDDRRFGILWMSHKALAETFDLDGAFNSVTVKLLRDVSPQPVMDEIDKLLDRYGGRTAFARKDQQSHAFIDAELQQLAAMSRILPPIFLLVSAFLINMTLSRLITLEREQIGLMKALGYGGFAVGGHYLKMVILIALVGVVVGVGAGTWLGRGLTRLFAEFYHFPFLIFLRSPDVLLIAVVVSVAAAMLGAARSVRTVMKLSPAVAMSPPAPTRYRRMWVEEVGLLRMFSQMSVMVFRHLIRWPLRAAATALGISMSIALLITSLFAIDSVDFMIDTTFFQANRSHATLSFIDERSSSAVEVVARLPGVMRAEPYRDVAVRLRNGHLSRKVGLSGIPQGADLTQVLDLDLKPIALPEAGLVLSDKLASLIGARTGDVVEVEILEDRKRTVRVPVSALIQGYLGLSAYMDMRALNAMLDEGLVVSGVHFAYDRSQANDLYAAVKKLPSVNALALKDASLGKFRETMAKNITISTLVYTALSVIIAFGVVYNSARIQLSERSRELASLRVLGFTQAEVSKILALEIIFLTIAAVPLGWAIGYGFAWILVQGFDTELYRIPFIIERSTFAKAALIVLAASAVSMLIVLRRVTRLDLISVLKTRD